MGSQCVSMYSCSFPLQYSDSFKQSIALPHFSLVIETAILLSLHLISTFTPAQPFSFLENLSHIWQQWKPHINTAEFGFRFFWMFCNPKSMKKVNKIQERYLRLMTNNYELSHKELLDLTYEISPHQRCLNSLMTEVYKCLNGISADIMNDTLAVSKHRYNTQHYNLL